MKLTALERMVLLNCLPPEGNVATLRIVRQLRERLSFSEQELKDYCISHTGDQIKWDRSKEPADGIEIEIGEKATDLIVASLKKLDQAGKVTDGHLSLFDRFVT